MGVEMAIKLFLPRPGVVDPRQYLTRTGHRAHLLAACTMLAPRWLQLPIVLPPVPAATRSLVWLTVVGRLTGGGPRHRSWRPSDVGSVGRQVGGRPGSAGPAGRARAGEAEGVGRHRQRSVGVAVDEDLDVRHLGGAGETG